MTETLPRFCPSCGAPRSAGEAFCGQCGAAATPVGSAVGDYAGFWPRVGAALIDTIIVLLGAATVTVIAIIVGVGLVDEQSDAGKDTLAGLATAVFLIALFIGSWLYTALYEAGIKQATPGKRLLGLIVTDEQGQRISFARATARYFSESFLTGNTFGIGYLIVIWTAKKQTVHDLVCSTVVIRRP